MPPHVAQIAVYLPSAVDAPSWALVSASAAKHVRVIAMQNATCDWRSLARTVNSENAATRVRFKGRPELFMHCLQYLQEKHSSRIFGFVSGEESAQLRTSRLNKFTSAKELGEYEG